MKLKAGLEVHQQLDCGKLFCNCDYLESGTNETFSRVLHATSSEMGDVDISQMGKVIGAVMSKGDGIDGGAVSKIVKGKLS